jgi:hypothetical protein
MELLHPSTLSSLSHTVYLQRTTSCQEKIAERNPKAEIESCPVSIAADTEFLASVLFLR